jgi:hypothetical protein
MNLYRAVPKENLDYNKAYRRAKTPRLPGNVPYFVDNIWEFFRPSDKPSRRYAIYASPSVELALENASAQHLARDQYTACRVTPLNPVKAFQLSVTDARYHPDIKNLQKLIHDYLYKIENPSFNDKQFLSVLFVPGSNKQDIETAIIDNIKLQALMEDALKIVSIWRDEPNIKGELFFELEEDNSYSLISA